MFVSELAKSVKSLQWRSRRGLLELDLLLVPFARRHLSGLSDDEQQCYGQLLDAEDPDMLDWFRSGAAPDPHIDSILRLILQYRITDNQNASNRN